MDLRCTAQGTRVTKASCARDHSASLNCQYLEDKTQVGTVYEETTIRTHHRIYYPAAPAAGLTSSSHGLPTTSNADAIEAEYLEASASEWSNHQRIENDYDAHRWRCARTVDPVAQQAVMDMDIIRFVGPAPPSQAPVEDTTRESLFPADLPLEDLSYSMRNFLVVNPVRDSQAVIARIAVKEGRAVAGYVPSLPQPRRILTDSETEECSEACGGK